MAPRQLSAAELEDATTHCAGNHAAGEALSEGRMHVDMPLSCNRCTQPVVTSELYVALIKISTT